MAVVSVTAVVAMTACLSQLFWKKSQQIARVTKSGLPENKFVLVCGYYLPACRVHCIGVGLQLSDLAGGAIDMVIMMGLIRFMV